MSVDEAIALGLVLLGVFLTVVWLIQPRARDAIERWHTVLPGVRASTPGCYAQLRERIRARGLPGVRIREVNLLEANPFSFTRRYLRVRRNNLAIYILASAVDKRSFLISYWIVRLRPVVLLGMTHVPGLRWLAAGLIKFRQFDTLFRGDAETLLKEAAHSAVVELVEELSPAGIGSPRSVSGDTPIARELYRGR